MSGEAATGQATCDALAVGATLEVVRAQARVVAEHPFLTGLLDALPDGILVLNPQRQIVFANRAARELAGDRPPAELVGLRPGEALRCVHAFEGPGGAGTSPACGLCSTGTAFLESRQTGLMVCREGRLLSEDLRHGPRALDVTVVAAPFELDGLPLTLLTLRDRSAEVRRAVLERIFFHDVLNLAGALQGLVRLLVDNPQAVSAHLLDRLNLISTRIVTALREQRDLSFAERGDLDPRPEAVRVAAVLAELGALYANHSVAAGRKIGWRRRAPADLCVYVDRGLLLRVLGNLLKNALEATPVGGHVTVTAEAADSGHVHLRVHNPGLMPPEVQGQVFQRSFTTKAGRGRGLGTFSAKLLTERYLGGRIGFESTAAEGTTFTVTLPTMAAVALPDPGVVFTERLDGMQVLLAEDDADCRWLTSRVLESAGARVTEVGDGASAVAAARDGAAFDLILLDGHMPGMDGLEAARALRAAGYRGPILALTASGRHRAEAARAAGCDGCLDKALEPDELIAALARHARRRNPAASPV